ncbi:hypothetical protein SAMN05428978_11104 [Nitrosomonas sp. Nm34]|nr:hypothetical protein SAMN05428978_11104 [Nitrosomonas sp. Nm34]
MESCDRSQDVLLLHLVILQMVMVKSLVGILCY